MKRKDIAFITLARAGSKRIKNKNFIKLDGKPLIQYTIDEVKKSKYYDASLSRNYIISSDSPDIREIAKQNGIMYDTRPSVLASDTATSADALNHVILKYLQGFKYVVEVMTTNPLKTAKDIDSVIDMMLAKDISGKMPKSVISVMRLWDNHPSRIKWINDSGNLVDFIKENPESRRQDLTPAAYIRNGSIYGMEVDWFLKHNVRYMTEVSKPYIMPPTRCINLDEPEDLEIAQIMLKKRNLSYISDFDGFQEDGLVI